MKDKEKILEETLIYLGLSSLFRDLPKREKKLTNRARRILDNLLLDKTKTMVTDIIYVTNCIYEFDI
jgi:hypothetical protein